MFLEYLFGTSSKEDVRFWNEVIGGARTAAGVQVNETTALNFSAYFCAISIIAGDTSTLPLHVYRRVHDDRRERVANHPLETILNVAPNQNGITDAISFRETLTANALGWGNGYAEIIRAGSQPVALECLRPSRVRVVDAKSGGLAYEVKNDAGTSRNIPPDRIFHLRGIGGDTLTGWSVARMGRETIGLALAAEKYGSGWFGNGARPGGVLKHPHRLSKTAADRIRESWTYRHGGPDNAHEVAVLEEGMDFTPLAIPPEDSQFLQTRQYQIREIARWFKIPSRFLGDPEGESYASAEMLELFYLNRCLRYWLEKWELAVQRSLFLQKEQKSLYVEHATEALLKTDLKARYEAYRVAREGGWMSANDVLRRENMNPVGPQGDIYLVPKNFGSAEFLAEHGDWASAPAPNPTGTQDGNPPGSGANSVPGKNGKGKKGMAAFLPGEANHETDHVASEESRLANGQDLPRSIPFDTLGGGIVEGQPTALEDTSQGVGQADAEGNQIHQLMYLIPSSSQGVGQADAVEGVSMDAPSQDGSVTCTPRATAAHRALLASTLARMIRKEMANVRQAAKKPGEFLEWLDSYYEHHQALLADAVRPALAAWNSISVQQAASEAVSSAYCLQSQELLLNVAGNATAAQFAAAVETCVGEWEQRAGEVAERVIV